MPRGPGNSPNPSRQMRTGLKGRSLDLWLNISQSWQRKFELAAGHHGLACCDLSHFFCIYGNPKKDGTTIVTVTMLVWFYLSIFLGDAIPCIYDIYIYGCV